MKQLRLLGLLCVLGALAVGAGIAYAALGDTQSASGSVNVSSTSADLYICEPGAVAGPACGADDNTGDESVFESLEDLRPGETEQWDIRLKNNGTTPFHITEATLSINETNDPGNDCPTYALIATGPPNANNYDYQQGIALLGKGGDVANDNPQDLEGVQYFRSEADRYTSYGIKIAPGDYEDVRLRLRLQLQDTENCDGNTWAVAWNFTVN